MSTDSASLIATLLAAPLEFDETLSGEPLDQAPVTRLHCIDPVVQGGIQTFLHVLNSVSQAICVQVVFADQGLDQRYF